MASTHSGSLRDSLRGSSSPRRAVGAARPSPIPQTIQNTACKRFIEPSLSGVHGVNFVKHAGPAEQSSEVSRDCPAFSLPSAGGGMKSQCLESETRVCLVQVHFQPVSDGFKISRIAGAVCCAPAHGDCQFTVEIDVRNCVPSQ